MAVGVTGDSSPSGDGARSTSYFNVSLTGLPSSNRAGAFQLRRAAPSRGSATTWSGSAGGAARPPPTPPRAAPPRPPPPPRPAPPAGALDAPARRAAPSCRRRRSPGRRARGTRRGAARARSCARGQRAGEGERPAYRVGRRSTGDGAGAERRLDGDGVLRVVVEERREAT